MKKFLLVLASSILLVGACGKNEEPKDPADSFNWTTFADQTVTLNGTSNILNQYGDTIAVNLAAGDYTLKVGSETQLTIVPSAVTKADDNKSVISFPSRNKYATVMVEDVYPYFGDYDFNDIVFGLRIDFVMANRSHNVEYINFNIMPCGVGSSYEKLGIGAYFRGEVVQPHPINTLTGSPEDISEMFTGLYPSGLEGCDEGFVIPLAGNIRKHFGSEETYTGFINTGNLKQHYNGVPYTVSFRIGATPYSIFDIFGTNENKSIIDIFVMVDQRGKEVHLKGQKPTSRNTVNGNNVVDYQKDGYVWMVAIDFPKEYPLEYVNIATAYPKFTDWVASKGRTQKNWYNNPSIKFNQLLIDRANNRDGNNLYEYSAK